MLGNFLNDRRDPPPIHRSCMHGASPLGRERPAYAGTVPVNDVVALLSHEPDQQRFETDHPDDAIRGFARAPSCCLRAPDRDARHHLVVVGALLPPEGARLVRDRSGNSAQGM